MKYALVTGASGGIGAAAVQELARRDWGVAIHYCESAGRAERLREELEPLGVPLMTVSADVSDEGQVRDMVEWVVERFGRLDGLVCCAGAAHTGLISQIEERDWRRLFGVNVDGIHYCCRAVLPELLKRHSGSIVTVSSMWGQVGASCEAAYSAAKGAAIAYTKALAKELGPSGIRVNCVAPGVIDTEMNAHLNRPDMDALAEETPLGRIGAPEEVARAIAFLAGDESSFITGQVLSPNGGLVI